MSAPHETDATRTQSTALSSIGTLTDVPLGMLHVLAAAYEIDEKAGKAVLRARLLKLAKKSGVALDKTFGRCKAEHGISIGVNPGKAGIIWRYVSTTILHCKNQTLHRLSVLGRRLQKQTRIHRPAKSPRPVRPRREGHMPDEGWRRARTPRGLHREHPTSPTIFAEET